MTHKIAVIGLGYVGLPLAQVVKALKRSDYESISTEEPVLIDIKGIIEDPTWRL